MNVAYRHKRINRFRVDTTDPETGNKVTFEFLEHQMVIDESLVPLWEKTFLTLLPIDRNSISRLKEESNEEGVLAHSAREAIAKTDTGGEEAKRAAVRGPVGTGDIPDSAKPNPAATPTKLAGFQIPGQR